MFISEVPDAQCVEINTQAIVAIGIALCITEDELRPSPHSSGLV